MKPANQSLVSLPVAEVKKGPEKEFEKKTLKSEDVKIDINAAGVNELTRLPGVGLATAENIVRYREENGPFLSVDSLMSVKGIGASKLKRIASAAVVR
ncbi:MAG: helix-hairpin-helix domain-containing protein [Fibrobacteres bacterium]|nr:helix-hairpin-helix domain-containing protein [Fibrobacterota bacterium]